jgi:hypothetical protein
MEKFLNTFAKTALIITITASIALGAYFLGKNTGKDVEKETTSAVSPTPLSSVTPTKPPKKVVEGGVDESAGLLFLRYSLEIPTDWMEKRENFTASDEKIFLSKDEYQISIFQAATGGAICLYPDDPDMEGPHSRYTSFVNLTTQDGIKVRRSGTDTVGNDGKIGYTICQITDEGDFNLPTVYGHISFSLPANYNEETLGEMDKAISSLNKR